MQEKSIRLNFLECGFASCVLFCDSSRTPMYGIDFYYRGRCSRMEVRGIWVNPDEARSRIL